MRVGRIQPDSPIAGAITRSAPLSSERVRPRTSVSPARRAIATKESAAGQLASSVAVDRQHGAVVARQLARQAHRHDLDHAPVHQPAAVPGEGREHAREAAGGPHGVAQVALAEHDRLPRVDVRRQHHDGHPQRLEAGRGDELVDERPQPAAREQPAAPAAHPHPGVQPRGLLDQLVEVGSARPGRRDQRSPAHARDAGDGDAGLREPPQHSGVRRSVRATASERQVELLQGGKAGRQRTASGGEFISPQRAGGLGTTISFARSTGHARQGRCGGRAEYGGERGGSAGCDTAPPRTGEASP